MARLDPLDLADIPELEETFGFLKAAMGFVPNSMLIMARKPQMVQALAGLLGAALAPGSVDPTLKSMISEVASKSAGCQYCIAHTSHGAHNMGIPQEKLDAIWVFEDSDAFSPAEKAALTVAKAGAQVPNGVTDAHFETLKEHFTEDEIVEIVAVIAAFGFMNRWNDTFATPLEEEPKEFATNNLPTDQWNIGNHG